MPRTQDSTCWSLIHRAADADEAAQRLFVERYYPVIEATLRARWRGSRSGEELRDGIQDVFAECLRSDGVLDRTANLDRSGVRCFRRFLFGVVKNVAREHEARWRRSREAHGVEGISRIEADEESLGFAFDRAWARAVIGEAVDLQRERAASIGPDALRRIDLLRLRFYDSLPVREIAARWEVPAEDLHRELTRSKEDFSACLQEVLRQQLGDELSGAQRQIELLAELLG